MIWTNAQMFIFFLLVILCVNYLTLVWIDKANTYKAPSEGFKDKDTNTDIDKSSPLYTWVTDPQLIYDEFYAGVYDQLTQQGARSQAKIALLKSMWNKQLPIKEWSVLDAGCGTGYTTVSFAKLGAGNVVGLDYSPAMLRQAQSVVQPAGKLSVQQKGALRWRQDSLRNPSACSAGEFTHICMFYFTFYYLQDQEEFFRFANLWIKPGGKLVIEVVNKYKFDPILESASPFVAFSLQKYSKERILKSKVHFDKFDYEAEFQLVDPKAEFYETFRFKNNHVRRQKHILHMPNISDIVAMGKRAGWKYTGFQDLNPLGFEYAYLIVFEKN